jgi:hypothetical protein
MSDITDSRVRDALAGEETQFLIDTAVFPGNSGGPVITAPQVIGIQGTTTFGRSVLLGIITSYLPYHDVAVSRQTGLPRVTFDENSGLAAVTPFDYIDETISEHRKQAPPFVATGATVAESEAPTEDMGTTPER